MLELFRYMTLYIRRQHINGCYQTAFKITNVGGGVGRDWGQEQGVQSESCSFSPTLPNEVHHFQCHASRSIFILRTLLIRSVDKVVISQALEKFLPGEMRCIFD